MEGVLEVFFLSMTPIGELRLAVPLGIASFKINWLVVFVVSVVGNIIPVLFLLWLLDPVVKLLSRFRILKRFFDYLFERTRKKSEKGLKKYGYLALTLFVSIPLPITGAWTGSVIAFLYKIPFKKALGLISLGVVIAGVIVSCLTLLGVSLEKYFGWPSLLILLLVILVFYFVYRRKWQT